MEPFSFWTEKDCGSVSVRMRMYLLIILYRTAHFVGRYSITGHEGGSVM